MFESLMVMCSGSGRKSRGSRITFVCFRLNTYICSDQTIQLVPTAVALMVDMFVLRLRAEVPLVPDLPLILFA